MMYGSSIKEVYDDTDEIYESFIACGEVNAENVVLEVVKKAEDSEDTVIRLYEAYNRRTAVKLRCFRRIKYMAECSLLEQELENSTIKYDGHEAFFEIRPLEIKTFKLAFH